MLIINNTVLLKQKVTKEYLALNNYKDFNQFFDLTDEELINLLNKHKKFLVTRVNEKKLDIVTIEAINLKERIFNFNFPTYSKRVYHANELHFCNWKIFDLDSLDNLYDFDTVKLDIRNFTRCVIYIPNMFSIKYKSLFTIWLNDNNICIDVDVNINNCELIAILDKYFNEESVLIF